MPWARRSETNPKPDKRFHLDTGETPDELTISFPSRYGLGYTTKSEVKLRRPNRHRGRTKCWRTVDCQARLPGVRELTDGEAEGKVMPMALSENACAKELISRPNECRKGHFTLVSQPGLQR